VLASCPGFGDAVLVALDRDIASYYTVGTERDRLRGPGGRLEFVRTQELLARFLPSPPAIIADVGAGTGVYALPLAAAGYDVHLLDPVKLHVEQALAEAREQQVRLASARVGDARRLPYADASADAALLLGPLYHLTDRDARLAALGEARRVLRPGGLLAAAAISRFASTFDGLARGFLADPRFQHIVERDLCDGQHRNPDPVGRPEWFTTAYFHDPDELRGELEDAGFRVEALVAVEGPGAFRPELDGWLEDIERREILLRAIRRVEAESTLLGASDSASGMSGARSMSIGRYNRVVDAGDRDQSARRAWSAAAGRTPRSSSARRRAPRP
jgi:ubiquinone/menaquinone biosynthesis C-methylase UbiE